MILVAVLLAAFIAGVTYGYHHSKPRRQPPPNWHKRPPR